jgi:hypothetical protein
VGHADPEYGKCPQCQVTGAWVRVGSDPALVIGDGTLHGSHLHNYCCSACQAELCVDGSEYAFLRKGWWTCPDFGCTDLPGAPQCCKADSFRHVACSFLPPKLTTNDNTYVCQFDDTFASGAGKAVVCFSWKLLHASNISLGDGEDWNCLWQKCLEQVRDFRGLCAAHVAMLSSLYKSFQQATQDFVMLREVDFSACRRCICPNPYENIICDGVAVSTQTQALYLLGPQLPEAEDTRLEWGSQYGQRICIPKRGLRISLRAFARSTAKEPMSGGDFDELNEGLRMEGGASLSLALLLCHLAVEHEMDVLQEQQVGFLHLCVSFALLCCALHNFTLIPLEKASFNTFPARTL